LADEGLAAHPAATSRCGKDENRGEIMRGSRLKRAARAALIIAAAAIVTPVDAATFVYVGNAESNDIDVLSLDRQTGDLTPVEKVAIPNVTKPGPTTPMAVSPDKRFLYIAVRSEPYIAASFAIDPATGKLRPLENGALNDALAYISTDRAGRFLFGASYTGNRYTLNPIAPEGSVWPPQYVAAGIPNAHEMISSPDNRFALGTSLGSDRMYIFKFDPTNGDMGFNALAFFSVKPKSGPRHFRFGPDGKTVFLLCELDGSLYTLSYDPDKGALAEKHLTNIMPSDYQGKVWAADLHLTPDGKYLYASERTTSTLTALKVADDGQLSVIGRYPTEQQPRAFNIDPAGKYLLSVGQLSHSLTAYEIDAATGTLKTLKSYPMGKNPNWVEIVDFP
jgi:6-phosphogluconolactonase